MLKYGTLALGLFSLTGIYEVLKYNPQDAEIFLILIVLYSATFIGIFILLKDKLKFVIIGKSAVIVKVDGKEKEYRWLDVEQINLNRFFGVYKMKIKNEDVIYFTAYGFVSWLFGDLSDMGEIINKMKRELDI
jgi:hypothetical protein